MAVSSVKPAGSIGLFVTFCAIFCGTNWYSIQASQHASYFCTNRDKEAFEHIRCIQYIFLKRFLTAVWFHSNNTWNLLYRGPAIKIPQPINLAKWHKRLQVIRKYDFWTEQTNPLIWFQCYPSIIQKSFSSGVNYSILASFSHVASRRLVQLYLELILRMLRESIKHLLGVVSYMMKL